MKTNILKLFLFPLIMIITFVGCKKEEFLEFQLHESGCNWINTAQNEIIVINSNTELEKHIDCSYSEFPEFDFSKHTLLLASGQANRGVYEITGQLKHFSKNNHTLDLTILLNSTQIMENWTYSILVSKLSNKAHIRLKTKYIN